MRSNLFKRIFVLYAAILLLAILGVETYVTSAVREREIAALRDNLAVQARLIGREVPFGHPVPLDELCRRYKDVTHSRVTIIGTGGKVLGDSDHESVTMDNHRDRLEVQQADLSGTGMAVRTSDTLRSDLLYVAVKVTHDGALRGFIRLSVPLSEVDTSVNSLRLRILVSVTAILLATGLFSLWQIGHLRKLTLQVRDFAAEVARGELGHRLFLARSGEFDEIARSLNSMSKDLQQSIAASREERDRLQVILNSIPDALLISDAHGVIRLSSSASRSFFGDAPLKGRQFIEVVRDSEFIALLDQVRRTRATVSSEITLDLPDERYFIATLSPLSYREGEISGFLALFHDITQLKKLEQVRKDFVANISHEIRTPITAIQGFAETLLEGALQDPENARSFVGTIRDNSRRINSLVDDLMTISRIELGVITVEKSDVAFDDVADAVLATFRESAARKGLSLVKDVPANAGTVRADRDRLVQIMTNLVDNAVKFTDKGSVTIGSKEEDGRTVLFVEDTGIGVAEKHLSRLGERFYRVDAARSRSMGGTGLGLAIVKHLVKAHGWEMQIESAAGKGTTVKVLAF
jgi:two-component system phosphate regulon sensor histidine kinase PhoR